MLPLHNKNLKQVFVSYWTASNLNTRKNPMLLKGIQENPMSVIK
jgi:hypothetical protein